MRGLGLVGLLWFSLPVFASERPVDTPPLYRWDAKDEEQIANLEKQVRPIRTAPGLQSTWRYAGNWIIQTEISPHFTAELAYFLSLFHKQFLKTVGFQSQPLVAAKPCVLIYNSQKKYRDLSGDFSNGRFVYAWDGQGQFTQFYFESFWDLSTGRALHPYPYSILQHECTHMLFKTYLGRREMPIFLNEGMATFFEGWDIRQSREENVQARDRHTRGHVLRAFARQPDWTPPSLRGLLTMKHEDWDPGKEGGPRTLLNYALAEDFIIFLYCSEKNLPYLRALLQRCFMDRPPDPLLAPADLAKLEAAWHAHLKEAYAPAAVELSH